MRGSTRRAIVVSVGALVFGLLSLVGARFNGGHGAGTATDSGSSGPNWVFLVMVGLTAAFAIGTTVWRVTTAQKLAKGSGMDPGLATKMTLLTENGLDDTYLAANLRGHTEAPAPQPEGGAWEQTMARLGELKSLLDNGAITQAEYDERRKAIVDSI